MKKGISLIVLVITIIVMIILAASVVISLSNTGIISKANTAVQLTDEKQVQDLASLIWADAYLDPVKKADIVNVVKQELANQGITEDKWDIEVSNSGVTVISLDALGKFAIGGNYYYCTTGMTWSEWVLSKYNTLGLIDTGSEIRTAARDYYLTENGVNAVYGTIGTGITYRLESAGNANAPTNLDLT